MNLLHYFEKAQGTGILATCNPTGDVDQAIYSKPYVVDENMIAFVMKSRLSRLNLKQHVKACYMFLEKDSGYKGVRLYLTKQHEEKSESLLKTLSEIEPNLYTEGDDSDKCIVFFTVDRTRPLVGD